MSFYILYNGKGEKKLTENLFSLKVKQYTSKLPKMKGENILNG